MNCQNFQLTISTPTLSIASVFIIECLLTRLQQTFFSATQMMRGTFVTSNGFMARENISKIVEYGSPAYLFPILLELFLSLHAKTDRPEFVDLSTTKSTNLIPGVWLWLFPVWWRCQAERGEGGSVRGDAEK